MTTATKPVLPPVCLVEAERVEGPTGHVAVGGRRVVWSAGNGAWEMRTHERRRHWQQLGLVVAAVAAVASLASVVSTWSIIDSVGYDPAAELWIAPSAGDVGGKAEKLTLKVTQVASPDTALVLPTSSLTPPPSVQSPTPAADSAVGRSRGPASVDHSGKSTRRSVTKHGEDYGSVQATDGSGENSGGTDPGPDVVDERDVDGVDGPGIVDGTDGAVGADGVDGAVGADGVDGAGGADGPGIADGTDGAVGADGVDGTDGAGGVDGPDGADGADGADDNPTSSSQRAGRTHGLDLSGDPIRDNVGKAWGLNRIPVRLDTHVGHAAKAGVRSSTP